MRDKKERKPLNVAEAVIVAQIQRWPTLYRDARSFYSNCIVGSQGSPRWEKGTIVFDDKRYMGDVDGKPVWGAYTPVISKAVAQDMLRGNRAFTSVHPSTSSDAPIRRMPDDMHKDWQEFISHCLYMDEKLTPDLYKTVVESFCIMQYGMWSNPNSSMGYYISEWEIYYKCIPSYKARLDVIREFQESGKIPAYTYTGMHI